MREKWITDWPTSKRFPHYTRANAGEVLANPVSPLGWSYGWDGGIVAGYKAGLIRCGLYEDSDFDPEHPESVACFGGYLYINLSAIRMQGVRNPAATVEVLDIAFFGNHPDVPPYVEHPNDNKPHLLPNLERHNEWVMSGSGWPEIDEDKKAAEDLRASRGDLSALSLTQLLTRARSIQSQLPHLFSQHVVSGTSAAMAPGLLGVVATTLSDPGLPMVLLSSLGDVDSADANYALWDLSRLVRNSPSLTSTFNAGINDALARISSPTFIAAWESFLYEFGSRGPDEWDLASPTWETHPQLALAAIDRVRLQVDAESPQLRNEARARQRNALITSARKQLVSNPEISALLEAGITAGAMMAHRERTKTTIVRVIHEARMVFHEIANRTGHGDLVFQVLDSELDAYAHYPESMLDTLTKRHVEWRELFDLQPPFIIADANVPALEQWARRSADSIAQVHPNDCLQGVSGSPGFARGRARVVLDPGDPRDLQPGDILVAPCTDPSWTPLFMTAAAVVVDVGGQISHAVIVSRELGLPCVVSVTNGTLCIPDGAIIEVDGTLGTITIVSLP